jgi:uncharacterized membrane protein required for colicin V production
VWYSRNTLASHQSKERNVTVEFRTDKPSDSDTEWLPLLLIIFLGAIGIAVFHMSVARLQVIELLLLIIAVLFAAAGYKRGTIRGIMGIALLYFATGMAATLYPVPAPYVAGLRQLFSGQASGGETHVASQYVDRGSLAISFVLLTILVWVVLEAIGRLAFPDTSLPKLGILDKLGGVFVHFLIGVWIVSLLFNAIGYGGSRSAHRKAFLRPGFNRILRIHYNAQAFWFPDKPPPIYVYDLDLPSER